MTLIITLAAILVSVFPVILLCIGDPKRRRAMGARTEATGQPRAILIVAACVPGLGCAVFGDSAALMMWLGGVGLLGWAAAAGFAARSQ